MTSVTMLFGLLFCVTIFMSVLQALQLVQDEEHQSKLIDKRFRDMENKFQDLLAKTKTEMDDKYIALLNDHVSLTKRFEIIENDNQELRNIVSSLKLKNMELENRLSKLPNDSSCQNAVYEYIKSRKSDHRIKDKIIPEGTIDKESTVKSSSDPDTKRIEEPESKKRRTAYQERTNFLPDTSTPSTEPVRAHERVAFHARLSQHLTDVSDNQHIEFNDVRTNVGNAYSEAKSTFTCPDSGTYVFAWTILSFPNKYIQTELVLNGNAVGYTHRYGDKYNSGSNMVVLDLEENDTVWVRVHSNAHYGGTVAYASYSTFSGFILW